MRANKTTLLFVLGLFVILFCVAPANMHYISTPRLVIKFDGKPASNVTLILPSGKKRSHQLDADGSITSRGLGSNSLILIPKPGGGAVSVGFPPHGTKVVDIRDRMTITTHSRYFGLVSEQFESFDLSDDQV